MRMKRLIDTWKWLILSDNPTEKRPCVEISKNQLNEILNCKEWQKRKDIMKTTLYTNIQGESWTTYKNEKRIINGEEVDNLITK